MRPIWFVRAAAIAAALLVTGFISLPSLSGAGLFTVISPTVDRTFKGDRLPAIVNTVGAPQKPKRQQSREKEPIGCDGAFSAISAPRSANVFRRCTV
jgi:hypothetical protein